MNRSTGSDAFSAQKPGISWPPLIRGILLKRYKRFIADVELNNGGIVSAHCPNSGSMKSCCEPGSAVYLSRSDRIGRRLQYTWEMIRMPGSLVGVNTNIPNRLTEICIESGQIPELRGYAHIRREVRYGINSRIDILLEDEKRGSCYVEVKNCTQLEEGTAMFPDAVTARGLKHLHALTDEVKHGNRAVIFFLVQRGDAKEFRPADHIDPAYGAGLRAALRNGVEMLVYDTRLSTERIVLNGPLPQRP